MTAIANAAAGDEIVLANGIYALGDVNCTADGTAAQPIVVRAATPRGADIDFSGVEGFRVIGAHWHFIELDITGVCPNDSDCEHAFHVSGAAHGFVLRGSRVMDFNAQLKVNASLIGSTYVTPNSGVIEYNEIGDSHGRETANPVTKLNIDTGEDWIVRGNYLHDAYKRQGDGVSYAAFMKSGSKRGLFERNLVLCSHITTGGTRIGLSFGGGGTGAQYCAPAFDPNVPCSIEHDGGTMRNNIIANCSDVGIYLNKAKDSHILFNTLIGTTGVDFRFTTTSGEAVGNLLTSMIRARDGAMLNESSNQMNVATSQFSAWYGAGAIDGDLKLVGDVSLLIGAAPMRADVKDDYCATPRPSGALTMGALEHSVTPFCNTTFPPTGPVVDPTGDGGLGGDAGNGNGAGGDDGGGCCQSPKRADVLPILFVLFVFFCRGLPRRRRR
jgi:hypothetical protein